VGSDERARFTAVYTDTYEQILGYAMRRCDLPEDSADVVAETFTIAWRRVDVLPAGDEARLWLYGIARRVLANHRRGERLRRARNAEVGAEFTRLFGSMPSPEIGLELQEIGRAFRSLSARDRELLSLVAWEGLEHAEIAQVMGCSRSTVSIRLHRARKRLSRALAKAEVDVTVGRAAIAVPLAEGNPL
jgi:RNA polymerase sigma-70 factor (ECF subfamily)